MISNEHLDKKMVVSVSSTEPGFEVSIIRIRPSMGWVSLKLYELWEYRELYGHESG
jgi:hypothetical protein